MQIEQVMRRSVDQAAPRESVREAAERMALRNVGTLVVVDDRMHPVGILTDRDVTTRVVARGLDPAGTRVGDVMSRDPRVVFAVGGLESALECMRGGCCRRLPVVDADGRLAGIVAIEDMVRAMLSQLCRVEDVLRTQIPQGCACDLSGAEIRFDAAAQTSGLR